MGATFFSGLEAHSQIVVFVSSFIADGLVGKVRGVVLIGSVLHAYLGIRQQKWGFTQQAQPVWGLGIIPRRGQGGADHPLEATKLVGLFS